MVSGTDNSIEIISYYYLSTGDPIMVDLSNYYQFWITHERAGMAPAPLYMFLRNQELNSQVIDFTLNAQSPAFTSIGTNWITGYAALWISFDTSTNFSVLGFRRS